MNDQSKALAAKIEPLRPLMGRIATTDFDAQFPYSACLTSSVVRAFEYVELTTQQEPSSSFFLVPALRAITEDIIFFRFLSEKPRELREMVVRHLTNIEVANRLRDQESFFKSFRPFQPVLRSQETREDIETCKDKLLSFWNSNGWPSFKDRRICIPQIRQMAEKSGSELLEVVYDFIYRLTSGAVHFNPQVLLRLGWGPSRPSGKTLSRVTFSTKNLSQYYLDMSQVYGSYLLCLYFEFFEESLTPNQEERAAIVELRKHLVHVYRWPEMVTFEEMNMTFPERQRVTDFLLHAGYAAIMVREGFSAGAAKLLSISDGGRPEASEDQGSTATPS